MQFRISDTVTDSLDRLTGDEQKAVKTTAFDLQLKSFATQQSCARACDSVLRFSGVAPRMDRSQDSAKPSRSQISLWDDSE